MLILRARLQDFRNIAFADLPLAGERMFFVGANAQGKSNLLEALGLMTALRSFRTQDNRALPRKGCEGFALSFEIEHEQVGAVVLEIRAGPPGRQVFIDGERVKRLGDFIGRFPVVALSSGDLMLLRGGPVERRRFMDLTFSAADAAYYDALRSYHRGVAERNRLLKKGGAAAEFSAFESEIARHAVELLTRRTRGLGRLAELLNSGYGSIAGDDEGLELRYRASIQTEDVEFYARMLRETRERDRMIGATQKGPHRDDCIIVLRTGGAREFGSDGQQRGVTVALRLAQAAYFQETLGLAPVLLADDVLGELDDRRRAGFWRACPPDVQIVATGTRMPGAAEAADWAAWEVSAGAFSRLSPQ